MPLNQELLVKRCEAMRAAAGLCMLGMGARVSDDGEMCIQVQLTTSQAEAIVKAMARKKDDNK